MMTFTIILKVFMGFIVYLYQNSVSSVRGYWNGVRLLIASAVTQKKKYATQEVYPILTLSNTYCNCISI